MPAITAIEPQRRKGRYSIFVDGDFVIGIGEKVVVELGLRVGASMTAERLAETASAEERRRALDNAARMLESRPRSTREIRDRLKQKGYEEPVIEYVAETLTRNGLIDDAQFAAAWVDARSRSRPGGVRKLRTDLMLKGVAKETIDEAVSGVTEEDEVAMASQLLAKKARALPDDPEARRAETQRLAGFLQRRGFGWSVVKQALAALGAGSEDGTDEED